MSKLKKGLVVIGLTNLEADVYLKLLKLKKARVSQLAKATKITRTQLYPLLEKLVKKGVVEKIDKKVIIYKAVETDKIISLLHKWKREQLNLLNDIESSLEKK